MEPSLIFQSQTQPLSPPTCVLSPSRVLAPSPPWELPKVRYQVPSAQPRPDVEGPQLTVANVTAGQQQSRDKAPGPGFPPQCSPSAQETRLTPGPVGLNLTDPVSEAGKRNGAGRDGRGEGTPTLAQEEPQTGLPSTPPASQPALPPHGATSTQALPPLAWGVSGSSSNANTGRVPGSPGPIAPLYKR